MEEGVLEEEMDVGVGGVRVGGGGVPGYSTCCLHPGFTKEINILLLTVLDC